MGTKSYEIRQLNEAIDNNNKEIIDLSRNNDDESKNRISKLREENIKLNKEIMAIRNAA